MTNSYYFDEETNYHHQDDADSYHDELLHWADRVASREITLAQVPRQLLLDSMFFDRVFFLVTGNKDGIDLYQKKCLLQSFIDRRQDKRIVGHCQAMVSDSSIDSVQVN